MIEIKNLCAGYSGSEVLHDFSTELKKGKVTIIIGPNGCGKSTLLKSMIRLNPATDGQIWVDGKNIETLNSSELAQKIAYIAQSRKTPDISVRRMVLHGRFAYLKYPRRYRIEDYAMAEQAMEWVEIKELADKNVSELSGGTQQKVYIAMALAQDTPVILMDEPTVFLDISHQLKTLKMAKKLAMEGKTVVMVLHDLPQAFAYADEILVMENGKKQFQGTPNEVFENKIIERIFNVEFCRIESSNGWNYFCK